MTDNELMNLLRETFSCCLTLDFDGYAQRLETARAEISEKGDPDALLGEWTLLSTMAAIGNAQALVDMYREAASLLRGHSRVIPRGTPLLFGKPDPFGTFWRKPGTADATAQLVDEAEALWERMTGGGQGTAALFRAQLSYFRGDLQTAKSLAVGAYRLAEKFGQKMEQLAAAELIGLLARHGLGGSYADSALAFLRRRCDDEKEPAVAQAAQLARSNIFLSMGILSETPDWIKDGDFGAVSDPGILGWRIVDGNLDAALLPSAIMVRAQYLSYSGRYVEALNLTDLAQLCFRITGPLTLLYFNFWRGGCYEALGEIERSKDCMRAILAGCAPDELWLIPGEHEAGLPLFEELGAQYGAEAVEKLKRIGNGLLDKLEKLRDAYIHGALPESLTRREQQVMELVSRGHTNAQTAQKLGIGEETVKTHLKHAYDKLGVSSRTQVALALGKTEDSVTAAWVRKKRK